MKFYRNSRTLFSVNHKLFNCSISGGMMMGTYREAYASVLKKNFMLLIIALVLVFFTFAYWIGIPLFVVSSMLDKLHMSIFISIVCIFLSAGLLFSLLFIPLNIKVAGVVGKLKQQSTLQAFIHLHLRFFYCVQFNQFHNKVLL